MATEISPLIVDPTTLSYEKFTTSQLTQILTELGEKDLSKKKRVLFEGYRQICHEKWSVGNGANDLLLDPSTLSENQYNKRGLVMALNARNEQCDSRRSKLKLFQVLLEWATKNLAHCQYSTPCHFPNSESPKCGS